MKFYTIVKKPEILDWTKIPVAQIDSVVESKSNDIVATGQLCYDDIALYVRLAAKEKNIRAVHTGPLDLPCEDSCLEFFFCPILGDDRYFNIEYNPNCCVYLGIASGAHDLVRLLPRAGIPFLPKASTTEDGWEVTYQIPFEFVRRFFPDFAPKSGTMIRGNFYKCSDLTVPPHYLCWSDITCNPASFHSPCDFGILQFE